MKLTSREYKLMVDPRPFQDRQAAIDMFWEDVSELAGTVPGMKAAGKLDEKKKREIVFLDTPDRSIRRAGLVFRERGNDEEVEYTLKCRSEDRYVASGVSLAAASGVKPDEKLEEDITLPFLGRFSHSNSVEFDKGLAPPKTLAAAGAIFPTLSTLMRDGRVIPSDTPLSAVHGLKVTERVFTGPQLALGEKSPKEASVALILWCLGGKGRPIVAEFSFRIKDKSEEFTRDSALIAREFLETLPLLDWFLPKSPTKTEFIYRDRGGD